MHFFFHNKLGFGPKIAADLRGYLVLIPNQKSNFIFTAEPKSSANILQMMRFFKITGHIEAIISVRHLRELTLITEPNTKDSHVYKAHPRTNDSKLRWGTADDIWYTYDLALKERALLGLLRNGWVFNPFVSNLDEIIIELTFGTIFQDSPKKTLELVPCSTSGDANNVRDSKDVVNLPNNMELKTLHIKLDSMTVTLNQLLRSSGATVTVQSNHRPAHHPSTLWWGGPFEHLARVKFNILRGPHRDTIPDLPVQRLPRGRVILLFNEEQSKYMDLKCYDPLDPNKLNAPMLPMEIFVDALISNSVRCEFERLPYSGVVDIEPGHRDSYYRAIKLWRNGQATFTHPVYIEALQIKTSHVFKTGTLFLTMMKGGRHFTHEIDLVTFSQMQHNNPNSQGYFSHYSLGGIGTDRGLSYIVGLSCNKTLSSDIVDFQELYIYVRFFSLRVTGSCEVTINEKHAPSQVVCMAEYPKFVIDSHLTVNMQAGWCPILKWEREDKAQSPHDFIKPGHYTMTLELGPVMPALLFGVVNNKLNQNLLYTTNPIYSMYITSIEGSQMPAPISRAAVVGHVTESSKNEIFPFKLEVL